MITHSQDDNELLNDIQAMNKKRFQPIKPTLKQRLKTFLLKWINKL